MKYNSHCGQKPILPDLLNEQALHLVGELWPSWISVFTGTDMLQLAPDLDKSFLSLSLYIYIYNYINI